MLREVVQYHVGTGMVLQVVVQVVLATLLDSVSTQVLVEVTHLVTRFGC